MPGFEHVAGTAAREVAVTTLDAHDRRARAAALHQDRRGRLRGRGAGRAVAAGRTAVGSNTCRGCRRSASAAIDRFSALGDYEFNVVRGENAEFDWQDWRDIDTLRAWLDRQAPDSGSGDVYARLRGA